MFWKNLKRAITYRQTLNRFSGPLLTFAIYAVIKLVDPQSAASLSFSVLFAYLALMFAGLIYCNYNLASGRWKLPNWQKRFYYFYMVPNPVFFALACGLVPKYAIVGVILFLGGGAGISMGVFRRRYIVAMGFLFCAFYTMSLFFAHRSIFFEQWLQNLFVVVGVMVASVWTGLASNFFISLGETGARFLRTSRKDKRTIAEERKKSDKLLLNILPEEIASELKEKGAIEPILFESATVCFTDFKGFTKIAEQLTPKELVGELDRCFSYFDSLMDRYHLEKLKTIGDSFMCVGGIPTPNSTHAVDCVLAAMEIQAFMNQMKEIKGQQGLDYWELRLGIHSGPIVAGVIGEKKFTYDVWSDTVNTASRCESSGVPGRINISGATYQRVKDFFECEYRGAIPAKHKGEIEMYFVNGIKSALSRNGDKRVPNEKFQGMYAELEKQGSMAR